MSRKGSLVNIQYLPLLTILDDNNKLKVVELESIVVPKLDGFIGDVSAYHHLKAYLNQPIQYIPSKKTQNKCILLDSNGNDIGVKLVQMNAATFDLEELANSILYSQEEVDELKKIQPAAKQPILNCVKDNHLLQQVHKLCPEDQFALQTIKGQVVICQKHVYIPVQLINLNLSCANTDDEVLDEFLRVDRKVKVKLSNPIYQISTQKLIVLATLPLQVEANILSRGWADLTVEAESQLDDKSYEVLNNSRIKATKEFRGIWSNPVDIFQLAYSKDNFLAQVVQVEQGHIFLMKNIETGQYLTVEVFGVLCPTNEEIGAYEAREFSRKEALGREFYVFIRKQLGFRHVASLVRVRDSERYNKVLISNGWTTIKDEKQVNDSENSRLLELQKKCKDSKIGLFSAKLGKMKFEDLSKPVTIELRDHLRNLYDRLTRSFAFGEEKLISGVVIGARKNNVFSVRLREYKFIVNVELEGVSTLDMKLVIKEYTNFKQQSTAFLRDNIFQRDVELDIVDFHENNGQLVGYMYLNGQDVAQILLSAGLVHSSGQFSELANRQYARVEQEARLSQKGLWTPVLNRLKCSKQSRQPEEPFRATISEVINGTTIYYQTNEALNKLDTIIAPALSKGITIKLQKEHFKAGNLCVAPFEDGNLYRAKIVSIKKKSHVKCVIIYIDYGNTVHINTQQLFELPEELMKIEELANKSRLFLLKNLNPKMDTKLACIDEIKNIILNKEFTLKPIDIESVCLYADEKCIHEIDKSINAEIIGEGLAKVDPEDLRSVTPQQQQFVQDLMIVAKNDKSHTTSVWLEASDEEIKKQFGDL